ncbi:MAG TPA: RNA polymerase sigma factor [Acidimicrobiia bacterium]|jgi:RNA polymerase sigma-70 factor (ECF subfamily)
MKEERTDAEIVAASRDDPELFGLIFRRHYGSVFGFVVGTVGSIDGLDLASETFSRAFAHRDRFDLRYPSARPWLLGIAANLIADHFRKLARSYRANARLANLGRPDSGFEDESAARLDALAARPLVVRAMSSLRKEEAEVVALYVLADLSYAEISEALGIGLGTVRSRLSRARAKLGNLARPIGESMEAP